MSANQWGGFELPRAGMIADNRRGDLLILSSDRTFKLMREFSAWDAAVFATRYPTAVRWMAREGGCVVRVADKDAGTRADDDIQQRDDGDLYLLRQFKRWEVRDPYPLFAELLSDPAQELVLSEGATEEATRALFAELHPIRQALKAPRRKKGGAGRGAPWYLSRGREVPPLQLVRGGAA